MNRYDSLTSNDEKTHFLPRRRALLRQHATGACLEVGAGTGSSIDLWPSRVTRLVLLEPSSAMRRQLSAKLSARTSAGGAPPFPVEATLVAGALAGDGSLPFADGEFDVVLSSLTLCSVPRLHGSLREIRRVLKVGGKLLFLEHVPHDGWMPWIAAVVLAPIWRAVFCCSNLRCTHRSIEEVFGKGDVEYEEGGLGFLMKLVFGCAVSVAGKRKE